MEDTKEPSWIEFFSKHPVRHYKKGEMIFRADQNPHYIYCIKSGYTRAYVVNSNGSELTLMNFKKGETFPTSWAINNNWNRYYNVAITPVELWKTSRSDFLNYIKSKPDVLFELSRNILTRLGELLQRMEHLNLGNAQSRVASIIAISAKRFGTEKENRITISIPLSHRDIGTLIGLTRETVSIEMHRLKENGAIVYKNQMITIIDMEKLKSSIPEDIY